MRGIDRITLKDPINSGGVEINNLASDDDSFQFSKYLSRILHGYCARYGLSRSKRIIVSALKKLLV